MSQYPWDGKITIKVNPAKSGKMALNALVWVTGDMADVRHV